MIYVGDHDKSLRFSPFGLLADPWCVWEPNLHIKNARDAGLIMTLHPDTRVVVFMCTESTSSLSPPSHLIEQIGLKTVDKLDIDALTWKRVAYKDIADLVEWRLSSKEREGYILEEAKRRNI